jgi:hypothetical protein
MEHEQSSLLFSQVASSSVALQGDVHADGRPIDLKKKRERRRYQMIRKK